MAVIVKAVRPQLALLWKRLMPFMLCAAGGLILSASRPGPGWFPLVCAAICWAWALDLAASQARADTIRSLATEFWKTLSDDKRLTLEVAHTYHADDETRAAMCAAQGTPTRSAETEGLRPKDGGPVAEGHAPDNTD